MICQRCKKQEAKGRWVVLSGKPLREHVQELCSACFLKAMEEGPDAAPAVEQISRSSDRGQSRQKQNPPSTRKPKKNKTVAGLEGCYIKVGHTAIRFVLNDGAYQWGARDIHDSGTFTATQPDEFTCLLELSSELFGGARKQCRMTRRGKTYTVKELPHGEEGKFKRDDEALFLAELPAGIRHELAVADTTDKDSPWRRIEHWAAEVEYQLTGESIIRAATIPSPPSSKTPTVVRITHSNSYGLVDSDVFVRLGDPKRPLGVQDFDTVSDWQKAELVEDLLWKNDREEWVLRSKAKGDTSVWSGTYEVEIEFPKGHHQIELKIISRVEQVCSIVLSNWKVYVR
jgi:hypothetical protein